MLSLYGDACCTAVMALVIGFFAGRVSLPNFMPQLQQHLVQQHIIGNMAVAGLLLFVFITKGQLITSAATAVGGGGGGEGSFCGGSSKMTLAVGSRSRPCSAFVSVHP